MSVHVFYTFLEMVVFSGMHGRVSYPCWSILNIAIAFFLTNVEHTLLHVVGQRWMLPVSIATNTGELDPCGDVTALQKQAQRGA